MGNLGRAVGRLTLPRIRWTSWGLESPVQGGLEFAGRELMCGQNGTGGQLAPFGNSFLCVVVCFLLLLPNDCFRESGRVNLQGICLPK